MDIQMDIQSLPPEYRELAGSPFAARRMNWLASARPEQLPPPEDLSWRTLLLLSGRGYGKTRASMEDAAFYGLKHPGARIAIVGETFGDGRDVLIEGESGLLSCLGEWAVSGWNRSLGELILPNRTRYKLYSGDRPDQLRGPQHHRAYVDELAKFDYPDDCWTQLQLGLRLGEAPRALITTTPRAIPLIRQLMEQDGVIVQRGSTFDNAANLSEAFLREIRLRYEGTRLGDQELYGEIVDFEGASAFQRQWFGAENRYDINDRRLANRVVARWASLDTADTASVSSAYSALAIGELLPDYRMLVRRVARDKLEFPDLTDWVISHLAPYTRDRKLRGVLVESAASGRPLLQTLTRSGPAWLESLLTPIKPKGKERTWQMASVWCKHGSVLLPHPDADVPWLLDFEEEFFNVPNAQYADQADSLAQMINHIEETHGAFSERHQILMKAGAGYVGVA